MLIYLKELQYQRIKLEVKSPILSLLSKVITAESFPCLFYARKMGFLMMALLTALDWEWIILFRDKCGILLVSQEVPEKYPLSFIKQNKNKQTQSPIFWSFSYICSFYFIFEFLWYVLKHRSISLVMSVKLERNWFCIPAQRMRLIFDTSQLLLPCGSPDVTVMVCDVELGHRYSCGCHVSWIIPAVVVTHVA